MISSIQSASAQVTKRTPLVPPVTAVVKSTLNQDVTKVPVNQQAIIDAARAEQQPTTISPDEFAARMRMNIAIHRFQTSQP